MCRKNEWRRRRSNPRPKCITRWASLIRSATDLTGFSRSDRTHFDGNQAMEPFPPRTVATSTSAWPPDAAAGRRRLGARPSAALPFDARPGVDDLDRRRRRPPRCSRAADRRDHLGAMVGLPRVEPMGRERPKPNRRQPFLHPKSGPYLQGEPFASDPAPITSGASGAAGGPGPAPAAPAATAAR